MAFKFELPAPSLDPQGFKSRREADNIAPEVALQIQKTLKNLRTGGDMFVGIMAQPMPIQLYLDLGGPAKEPVYVQFIVGEVVVSARNMAELFNNNSFLAAVGGAYAAFEGVEPSEALGVVLSRFPQLLTTVSETLEAIAEGK